MPIERFTVREVRDDVHHDVATFDGDDHQACHIAEQHAEQTGRPTYVWLTIIGKDGMVHDQQEWAGFLPD